MAMRRAWTGAVAIALAGCVDLAPAPTAPKPASPTPSASASPVAVTPPVALSTPAMPATPLPPGASPTPVPASPYNAALKAGKSWVFAQAKVAGGTTTRARVRVVVVDVRDGQATIAIQDEPFPSYPTDPGSQMAWLRDTPGKRSTFALDAANPYEKWGRAGEAPPAPTSDVAETVTVPAGTFEARKLTYDATALGYVTHRELWVDLAAGLVKLVSTYRPEGGTAAAGGSTTWELEALPG